MINEEKYIDTISNNNSLSVVQRANNDDLFDTNSPFGINEESLATSTGFYTESKGKHIQTFSARVLDWDDYTVKVELLINRDEKLYQVRMFPIEMFEGTRFLQHGYFIRILFFVKKKNFTTQIEDGRHFVSKDDFPEFDIFEGLDSKLFKF